MEACLGAEEQLEILKERALVRVPSRIGVAIVNGKLGLGLDMKVWFYVYASKGTELQLVLVWVPDPFVGVCKDTEPHVMCAHMREATLYEPGIP